MNFDEQIAKEAEEEIAASGWTMAEATDMLRLYKAGAAAAARREGDA